MAHTTLVCACAARARRKEDLWPHVREFADNGIAHVISTLAKLQVGGRAACWGCVRAVCWLPGVMCEGRAWVLVAHTAAVQASQAACGRTCLANTSCPFCLPAGGQGGALRAVHHPRPLRRRRWVAGAGGGRTQGHARVMLQAAQHGLSGVQQCGAAACARTSAASSSAAHCVARWQRGRVSRRLTPSAAACVCAACRRGGGADGAHAGRGVRADGPLPGPQQARAPAEVRWGFCGEGGGVPAHLLDLVPCLLWTPQQADKEQDQGGAPGNCAPA